MDGFGVNEPTPNGMAWAFYADPSTTASINTSVAFRHGSGNAFSATNGARATNVVFLDGHAETMAVGDFLKVYPSPENSTLPSGVTFKR